jgi:hypothetical protein
MLAAHAFAPMTPKHVCRPRRANLATAMSCGGQMDGIGREQRERPSGKGCTPMPGVVHRWPPAARLTRLLVQPLVAYVLYTGYIAILHTPPIYELMLRESGSTSPCTSA